MMEPILKKVQDYLRKLFFKEVTEMNYCQKHKCDFSQSRSKICPLCLSESGINPNDYVINKNPEKDSPLKGALGN